MNARSLRANAALIPVMLLCAGLLSGLAAASGDVPANQEPVPTLAPPTLVPTVESGMSDALPSESAVARIQRDGSVRVGILYNEPPFGELNIRGEVSGFDADLARAIAEAWEVELELIQVTRQTALDMLLGGQVDLLIAAQVHRRELDGLVEFSQAYYPASQMMLVRQDDGATVLGHMANRKVGVVMGTRGEQAVMDWLARSGLPVTVLPFINLDQALSALLTHEIDGVVESRIKLSRAIPEAGTARFVDEVVAPEPYAIAMRRQDANLRNLVNRTLQFLVESGKMNEIHQANFADANYPGETFTIWDALGDDPPKPTQFGTDMPYPTQYVVPRLQNERVVRVAGFSDLPDDADESARRLDAVNRAMVEAMAARWGARVEYLPDSRDNALELVASGQADLAAGVEPTWEWADRVDFTQHYLLHGERLMVKKDNTAESFGDLRGEWIGYFVSEEGAADRIAAFADEARALLEVFALVNEEDAAFGMTVQNNYDAVFGDSLKLIPHLQANPDDVRLTTGGDDGGWYSKHYLGFAVPRNDLDFRLLVEYTMQELVRDGTMMSILQPVMLPEEAPPVEVADRVGGVVGARTRRALRPDRDHPDEQRQRRQRCGFFHENLQHACLHGAEFPEHMRNIVPFLFFRSRQKVGPQSAGLTSRCRTTAWGARASEVTGTGWCGWASPENRKRPSSDRWSAIGLADSSGRLVQLDDLAVGERHPPIHPAGQFHVVGRDQHRDPRRPHQLHQRVEDVIGGLRVEVAGRLVRKQRPRRVGHRTRNRDALLLAAGKFRRPVIGAVGEAKIAQDFSRALDGFGTFQAPDHLRHHDVFQGGEFRQQPVRLIDEADVGAADLGAVRIRQLRRRGAPDIDLAVIGRFQQARNVQQRGLART